MPKTIYIDRNGYDLLLKNLQEKLEAGGPLMSPKERKVMAENVNGIALARRELMKVKGFYKEDL